MLILLIMNLVGLGIKWVDTKNLILNLDIYISQFIRTIFETN